jgi:signal transduction histidine kinase
MAEVADRLKSLGAAPGSRWFELLYAIGPVLGVTVLALATVRERAPDGGLPSGLGATLLLVVVPLSLRRVLPLAVLIVVSIGALITAVESPAGWVQAGAVGLASFTLGERASDRTRSALFVLAVAALVTVGFLAQDVEPVEAIVLPFVVLVPTWLLGDVLRARRIEAEREAEALERARREHEAELRAAAADERRHMARELHDGVAHAVSVMVIQAGAARQVVHTSPARAEDAMRAVESTGREAMAELRRLLGALTDDDETAGLAPQPGIGDLPALLDRVREAGLEISLEVDGAPRTVPASLDVTVYRIVQEALTNALRHARQAATRVRLSWEADQLRVEILDDGSAIAGGEGSGRGLVGMRERASLVGGRLEAGPRPGGGYAVRAWLPVDPSAPAREPETP